MSWVLHEGDSAEVLKSIPDNSIDAIITDPPAGIAFMQQWDDFRRARNPNDADRDNVFGRTSRTGPEYGRSVRANFIGWLTPIMEECHRVLKPGGYALVWAIPRTSHWTATAIEDANFTIKDCIQHLFGSGFPKSLDLSKAADKAAGAERTTVRTVRYTRASDASFAWQDGEHRSEAFKAGEHEYTITEPMTDLARQLQGWGTNLKPSCEFWWLAQKPLDGTYVANFEKWGVGGLNIDGCRIAGQVPSVPQPTLNSPTGNVYGFQTGHGRNGEMSQAPHGRWPAHTLFSHHPDCKPLGPTTVPSDTHYPASRGKGGIGLTGHAGQDGLDEHDIKEEVVDEWSCVEGCPVKELNDQSGVRRSGKAAEGGHWRNQPPGEGIYGGGKGLSTEAGPAGHLYGDVGGASRYFQTFLADDAAEDFPRFLYCPKASTADRNFGCESLVPQPQNSETNIRTYNDRCATCGKKFIGPDDKICHCPPGEKITDKTVYKQANNHPTVKSTALAQYLCVMVTPPGGTVLDPFCGSGSIGVGAIRAGFNFIGIEQDAHFADIARARIAAAERQVAEGKVPTPKTRATRPTAPPPAVAPFLRTSDPGETARPKRTATKAGTAPPSDVQLSLFPAS